MVKKKSEYEIGNKLEEAYCSKPLQEEPSEETVAKWIAIAEQRRAERRRRNHKLISCAAALLMCVCVGVTCAVNKPNAVAGSTGGNKVEVGMETVKIYSSIEDMSKSMNEGFVVFPESILDLVFIEGTLIGNSGIEKVSFLYTNSSGDEVYIKEVKGVEKTTLLKQVDSEYEIKHWGDMEVYINTYGQNEEVVYNFMYNNMAITINSSGNISEDSIRSLLEKAVHL